MTDEHPPRTCEVCGDPATARLVGPDGERGLRCDECLADALGVERAR